jgi:DNA repair protein RadC
MFSSKDLEPESPKKRLAKYGADSLSIQELLAVLLFPGYSRNKAIKIAVDLLKTFDGNLINLFTATIHQLTQVQGIGFVKACQIKATFELGNRIESYCEKEHPVISSTEDVVKLLAPHMRYLKQEEFRVLLLNSKKRLIRHCRVSLGSLGALTLLRRTGFYSSYPFHNLYRGLLILSSHLFDHLSIPMKCVFISTGSLSKVHRNLIDSLRYFFVPILCTSIMRKEAS